MNLVKRFLGREPSNEAFFSGDHREGVKVIPDARRAIRGQASVREPELEPGGSWRSP
jgi:hypothetical protein